MSKVTCPICFKEAEAKHLPFCSSRCKLIDLNKWMSEGYYIPVNDIDEENDLQKNEESH